MNLREIKTEMANVVKQLKTANGKSTNIPDDHIYLNYHPKVLASTADNTYPKVFIALESGDRANDAGMITSHELDLWVVFVGKLPTPDPDPDKVCALGEKFVEEFSKALDGSYTLNGKVISAEVTSFALDSGFTHPESTAACKVTITVKEQTGEV